MTNPAHSASATGAIPREVSTTWLLGIYAILPICLVIPLADMWLFDRAVWRALPKRPEGLVLFKIFFGTPHILASTLILFGNRDYLDEYKGSVLKFAVAVGLAAALLTPFASRIVLFVIVASWTVIHVVKQQLSIGNSCYRLSGPLFQAWIWSILGAALLIFNLLYLKRHLSPELKSTLNLVLAGLALGAVALSALLHNRIETTKGKIFFWSNTAMMLLCWYLLHARYHFFVILAPRVIHDVTAFTFYMVHDHNKHASDPQPLLFRWASRLGLHAFWVSPVVAIGLTALINLVLGPGTEHLTEVLFGVALPIVAGIVGFFSLLHYYTEAFTWRQGSPYRAHIPLRH